MPSFLSLLSPTYIKIILIIAVIGGLVGLGYNQGYKSATVKWQKEEKKVQEAHAKILDEYIAKLQEEVTKNNELSAKLEAALKKTKIITKEVIKYVDREVEKPVYRECVVPDTGVSILNSAGDQFNKQRSGNSQKDNSSKSSSAVRTDSAN